MSSFFSRVHRVKLWAGAAALFGVVTFSAAPAGAINLIPVGPTTTTTTTPPASTTTTTTPPTTTAAQSGQGYWLVASDGGVYQFATTNYGQQRGNVLKAPVVAMAATPDGGGYWLAGSDGSIFPFGDARFLGSLGNLHLNAPVVGIASSGDGGGYWMVATDGGIFQFGDAPYLGSMGGTHLNEPIVGMAATPDGGGYWLVASDGGIFTFGDAKFFGSTGAMHLNAPILGMAPTPDGNGYWLVAADGGIFTFGDAKFFGSTGAQHLNKPIIGMAATADGNGYWLAAADGGIFTFGDASYRGSTGAAPGPAPIIGITSTGKADPFPTGASGFDVSQFDCGALPPTAPVAVVQISGGFIEDDPGTTPVNPCFKTEATWAGPNASVYIFMDGLPTMVPTVAMTGPGGSCAATDANCQGYNYGWYWTQHWVSVARADGVAATLWWLDVESPCNNSPAVFWRCGAAGLASNAQVVQGAIDALHSQGLLAGIYSTFLQYPQIVGTLNEPGIPIWIAGASSAAQQAAYCTDPTKLFAGGIPWLVQWPGGLTPSGKDVDYACA